MGANECIQLSSHRCEDGSDQEEGVQSDDREEEADVSKGSDFSESQDRRQELDTKSDPILEHSGIDSF